MGLCPSTTAFRSSSTGASSTTSQSPAGRFSVVNVDEFGNDGSKGIIEVYPEGILLRRRHTSDVFWPLRSLRRYGRNEDLFTFESGRQCETGPGVFAFRLKRPEKLFSTVKQVIESEAQALIDGTRHIQQTPVSTSDIGVVLVSPQNEVAIAESPGIGAPPTSRFTATNNPTTTAANITSTPPANPPSLFMLSRMPATSRLNTGGVPGGDQPQHMPFPTHHEFIEGTPQSASSYAKVPSDEKQAPSQTSRASRPPPLNLLQPASYTQAQPKPQQPPRWDYVDLAEPSPTNNRSPLSTNGNSGPKSIPSARSTNTDSSTHYTQVDISRTDAIRNASTAAPSSAIHSSHGSSAFSIPSVNGGSRATSSSASLSANSPAITTNGNHRPPLPVVSKSARGSD